MAEKTWAQRCGLTPVKSALIVVLIIVLLAVTLGQFGGRDQADGPLVSTPGVANKQPRINNARPAARSKNIAVAAQASPRAEPARVWPRMSVEAATQFNPLRLPDSLASARRGDVDAEQNDLAAEQEQDMVAEQRRARRQALQDGGISMVVVGPHGRSAYLGTQLVREGDMIGGFVVKQIGPDGVLLADPENK